MIYNNRVATDKNFGNTLEDALTVNKLKSGETTMITSFFAKRSNDTDRKIARPQNKILNALDTNDKTKLSCMLWELSDLVNANGSCGVA